jgi:hypothetical protein
MGRLTLVMTPDFAELEYRTAARRETPTPLVRAMEVLDPAQTALITRTSNETLASAHRPR